MPVYFIDSVGGNDANPGTSKSAPWARAPGMKNGSVVAHVTSGTTYTPSSGDQFIFKLGSTWLASYSWTISWPNTTWTTDSTWGSGAAVFDVQHSQSGNAAIFIRASNVTIDGGANFGMDFKNAVALPLGGGQETGTFGARGASNFRITNAIIRDWWMSDITQSANTNGGAVFGSGGSVTVDNCQVNQAGAGQITGQAFYALSLTHHCDIHHVNNGWNGGGEIHHCVIHDCPGPSAGPGSDHQNVVTFSGNGSFHDNLVYNLNGANGPIQVLSSTINITIYNSVFFNTGGQQIIHLGTGSSGYAASSAKIYNCTFVDAGGGCVRIVNHGNGTYGTLDLFNNHMITTRGDADGVVIDAGSSITNYNRSNNLKQSSSAATAAGYTSTNNYQPTSGSSPTVDQGTTIALVTTDRLGITRPRGTAYDIGAYEWNGIPPTDQPVISVNPASLDWGSVAI